MPGKILTELVQNSRVIGGIDAASAEAAKRFMPLLSRGSFSHRRHRGEMTKLMENTYRDVNIALANEFALIAERTG